MSLWSKEKPMATPDWLNVENTYTVTMGGTLVVIGGGRCLTE
jgi:hypothetical protein